MSDSPAKTLLPEGLRDVLPPDAAFEGEAVNRLTRSFAANGYDLVRTPLVEFEDTLLSGVGAAMGGRIFRMLDPVSHRTLGVRSDITTQIARLAGTRLARAPRPLRLLYAGPVLRVRGSQLEPERQFTQVGIELIGAPGAAADAEAIVVTTEALADLGVRSIVVDLAVPTLVPAIVSKVENGLRAALDHKDVAQIRARGGAQGPLLADLAAASGPIDRAAERVASLNLPPAAEREWAAVVALREALRRTAPALNVTLDTVESRGFEYHSGITFSLFAEGSQREIGRGGRYVLPSGEAATGATLIVEAVLGAVAPGTAAKRIMVPAATDRKAVRALQDEGWITVVDVVGAADPAHTARVLGCGYRLDAGRAVQV
jgi:ATP phosphoribosyltransferase regulatory subunit